MLTHWRASSRSRVSGTSPGRRYGSATGPGETLTRAITPILRRTDTVVAWAVEGRLMHLERPSSEPDEVEPQGNARPFAGAAFDVVALASSAGGIAALSEILGSL